MQQEHTKPALQPDNVKPASSDQEKTVSIIRVIDLPVAEAWKAWTDAFTFMKWWGPAAHTCPHCEIDLQVGGKNFSCIRTPEGKDIWSTATYLEIDPLKKLVFTEQFTDQNGVPESPSYAETPGIQAPEFKVTVVFQVQGAGRTKMTFLQEGVPDEMHHDWVISWNEAFNKMEVMLKK